MRYTVTDESTFWVDPGSGRVIDRRWQEALTVTADATVGAVEITPWTTSQALGSAQIVAAHQAVLTDRHTVDRRRSLIVIADLLGAAAVGLLLAAAGFLVVSRRRRVAEVTVGTKVPQPIAS